MKKLVAYKTKTGKCPFNIWLYNLDSSVRVRIQKRMERVEQGHYGDYKVIDHEISELRFKFGAGYRVYFSEFEDEIVILFSGGDKSGQSEDIKKAKEYYQDLVERNRQ